MSEELKIRAARALEWGQSSNSGTIQCLVPAPFKHLVPQGYRMFGSIRIGYDKLEFDTSYDWANIGVKSLKAVDKFEYMLKLLLICHNGDSDKVINSTHVQDMASIVDATPEQMTQAWVEVVEGKNYLAR